MPLRSNYSRRQVNRVFTNRERRIAHFHTKVRAIQRNEHYILTCYGVGGQGKSALCKKLQSELNASPLPIL